MKSRPIVLLEGIHAFYHEPVRKMLDLKIFINTDDDVRLGRKLLRDIKERARTIKSVLHQYNMFSRKSYNDHIKPTMKFADIIIPYGRRNDAAVDFVAENIKTRLRKLGLIKRHDGASPRMPLAAITSSAENIVPPISDTKPKLKIMGYGCSEFVSMAQSEKDGEVYEAVSKLLYSQENGHPKYDYSETHPY